MAHGQYTAQFKTEVVLEVLRGEKELGEIAAQHNLNPNMVRNWKREFLEKASSVFEDPRKESREAKKKAEAQQKAQDHRAVDAGAGLSSGLLSPHGKSHPEI